MYCMTYSRRVAKRQVRQPTPLIGVGAEAIVCLQYPVMLSISLLWKFPHVEDRERYSQCGCHASETECCHVHAQWSSMYWYRRGPTDGRTVQLICSVPFCIQARPRCSKMETGAFICIWFHHLAEDRRVTDEIAHPVQGGVGSCFLSPSAVVCRYFWGLWFRKNLIWQVVSFSLFFLSSWIYLCV
jgi:hypothetical protein